MREIVANSMENFSVLIEQKSQQEEIISWRNIVESYLVYVWVEWMMMLDITNKYMRL